MHYVVAGGTVGHVCFCDLTHIERACFFCNPMHVEWAWVWSQDACRILAPICIWLLHMGVAAEGGAISEAWAWRSCLWCTGALHGIAWRRIAFLACLLLLPCDTEPLFLLLLFFLWLLHALSSLVCRRWLAYLLDLHELLLVVAHNTHTLTHTHTHSHTHTSHTCQHACTHTDTHTYITHICPNKFMCLPSCIANLHLYLHY
jgi:hypothetical protein